MEIPGKKKRSEISEESEEAEMEKFSEIVEKFRAPYHWFTDKMCASAIDSNDGDRRTKNKEKINDDDVWMPCFLLQDFEEEDEVIKVWKSKALRKSETAEITAAAAMTTETIQEKESDDQELDLRLTL